MSTVKVKNLLLCEVSWWHERGTHAVKGMAPAMAHGGNAFHPKGPTEQTETVHATAAARNSRVIGTNTHRLTVLSAFLLLDRSDFAMPADVDQAAPRSRARRQGSLVFRTA